MPRDDDWDDDGPDDWDDEPEIPCRNCGALMLETAPRCPSCGDYPSDEESRPSAMPMWVRALAAALALLFLWLIFGRL